MSDGGNKYGDADLPCELGSGTEGPDQSYGNVVGGGMIGNISIDVMFHCKKKKPSLYCSPLTTMLADIS